MRLDQASVEISTLVDKIRTGDIDLQPGFQRGEVWPDPKKRRLIDTILRGWYIPAIHLVVNDDLDKEEVLDGQQRLRSIIEFMDDEFPVDGNIEPSDPIVAALDGLRYSQLPTAVRSRFRRFLIRTVRLRDYEPEEPGELFFRLNQLTALTAAEQRNALVGTPRNQVKRLVTKLENQLSNARIGFSNTRMSYDDTVARLAMSIEAGGLHDQITATDLERRYRARQGFKRELLQKIEGAITLLATSIEPATHSFRLNRASLYSWLYFITDQDWDSINNFDAIFGSFFVAFEAARGSHQGVPQTDRASTAYNKLTASNTAQECLGIFNDRASSRVNDVSSVLLRDLSLNLCFHIVAPRQVYRSSLGEKRSRALSSIASQLKRFPSDVTERANAEWELAKAWETSRAES